VKKIARLVVLAVTLFNACFSFADGPDVPPCVFTVCAVNDGPDVPPCVFTVCTVNN